jgi:hypothetical protein
VPPQGSLIQDLAGGCSEEQLKAISPVHYIDENTPPTISIHGTMDSLVSYQQSTALHATLDEAGVDNYLISCPGWDHVLDVGYFGPQQLLRCERAKRAQEHPEQRDASCASERASARRRNRWSAMMLQATDAS